MLKQVQHDSLAEMAISQQPVRLENLTAIEVKRGRTMADGKIKVQKIDDYRWRIPREGKMRTDGIVYTDEKMVSDISKDQSLVQVANVAWLPGIVGHSLAMPDIHWGYGFPIGGVAAFDLKGGIISPGGVGYDIN